MVASIRIVILSVMVLWSLLLCLIIIVLLLLLLSSSNHYRPCPGPGPGPGPCPWPGRRGLNAKLNEKIHEHKGIRPLIDIYEVIQIEEIPEQNDNRSLEI